MDSLVDQYGEIKSLKRLHFELGRTHFEIFEYNEAIIQFERAKEIDSKYSQSKDPNISDIQLLLGRTYEQIGKYDEAFKQYLLGSLEESINKILLLNKAEQLLSKPIAVQLNKSLFIDKWIEQFKNVETDSDINLAYNAILSKFFFLIREYEKSYEHTKVLLNFQHNNVETLNRSKEINAQLKLKEIRSLVESKQYPKASGEIKKAALKFNLIRDEFRARLTLLSFEILYKTGKFDENLARNEVLFEWIQEKDINKSAELSFDAGLTIIINNITHYLDDSEQDDKDELILKAYYLKIQCQIAQHHYSKAINDIDEAMEILSLDTYLLYYKVQASIEGQIDIEEGIRLFELVREDILIKDLMKEILEDRKEDGNANLFVAYLSHLNREDESSVFLHLNNAEKYDLELNRDLDEKTITYLNIGIFVLKGLAYSQSNKLEEAATSFFEAGRHYGWLKESDKSLYYFEKVHDLSQKEFNYDYAISINSDFKIFYWLYSNYLYNSSFLDTPPYIDKEILDKADKVWNESIEIMITAESDIWVYETIVRILENQYKFVNTKAKDHYWKSIQYLERILVNFEDDWSWITLSRFYMVFDFKANRNYSLDKLTHLNTKNHLYNYYLSERVYQLIDKGLYNDVKSDIDYLIDQSKTKLESARYYGILGYIEYDNQNYSEAAKLFHENINIDPNNYWAYKMYMYANWFDGKKVEAKDIAADILYLFNDPDYYPDSQYALGLAKYVMGDLNGSMHSIEQALNRYELNGEPSYILLLLCLRLGEIKQANLYFESFSNNTNSPYELKSFERELAILEKDEQLIIKNLEKVLKIIVNWRKKIKDLINEGAKEISPIAELERELKKYKNGSIAWISCTASLARLKKDEGKMQEAFDLYDKLSNPKYDFPEALIAIEKFGQDIITKSKEKLSKANYKGAIQFIGKFKFDNHLKLNLVRSSILIISHKNLGNTIQFENKLIETLTIIKGLENPEYFNSFMLDLDYNLRELKERPIEYKNSSRIQNSTITELLGDIHSRIDWSLNDKMRPKSSELDLHPFIDLLLNAIRKRTEEKDGKRIVVEEYVIPEAAKLELINSLKTIEMDKERIDAFLSILAFSMMVEKQGWTENATKIRALGKALGKVYNDYMWIISFRMLERYLFREGFLDQNKIS